MDTMRILITGATGFLGQHLVRTLLPFGDEIHCTARDMDRAKTMDFADRVTWHTLNTFAPPENPYEALGSPDRLIHLAWHGLPDYKSAHHMEENLPADQKFLMDMAQGGLKHMTVTGTCFEYGMVEGELSEDMETEPDNPYGQAKDELRKYLEAELPATGCDLRWLRLFYMFGPGQNARSLFAALQKAIDERAKVFDMSGGEQIRDYLPIQTIAGTIIQVALQDEVTGVINVCSGRQATVRRLVEEYLAINQAQMELNLGHYPYPDWEPFRFWGSTEKLDRAIAAFAGQGG